MAVSNKLALLGWDKLAQSATITTSFTPVTGYGVANLNDVALATTLRSATLTGAEVTFDLGSNKSLAGFALLANLSDAATFRLRSSTVSNFASTVHDSGTIDVFSLTLGTASTWKPLWGRWVAYFGDSGSARYVRFTLNDSGNADAELRISVAAIGAIFQPAVAEGFESVPLADQIAGDAGAERILRGRRVVWGMLTLAERVQLAQITRYMADHGRCIVIPRPGQRETYVDEVLWAETEGQFDWSLLRKTSTNEEWRAQGAFREVDR
jgi:hypothetical protein